MKKFHYAYITLGLGLVLMLVVMKGSEIGGEGATTLPLLTLLAICEIAFFVTAIGAYFGIKHVMEVGIKTAYTLVVTGCVLLSARFLLLGIELWPLE